MKIQMKILFTGICLIIYVVGLAQISDYVKDNYDKQEMYITMRDGVKLFTSVYTPKDISATKTYPIIMKRTCYSVAPYGDSAYPYLLGPSPYLMQDKYIFVYQDVRGRYMSEGRFTNMTPHIDHKKSATDIDESSDTYDTIDWLIKNLKNNNGKVGQWGISYPGFYTAAGAMCEHPALVASSPQAPISSIWNDDFMHNGAFLQSYFLTFPVFGTEKTKPENKDWYTMVKPWTKDGYQFYYEMGAIKNGIDKYYKNNFFMQEIVAHPNYDIYWEKRNILNHFNKNVKTSVLTVGGWFDAEDLSGPLNIYKTIEKKNPGIYNKLVMTPFSHGGWSRELGQSMHNDLYFGDSIATFFQKEIEYKFFHSLLKENGEAARSLPEAYMYNTGSKQWQTFDSWPSAQIQKKKYYLDKEKLQTEKPKLETAETFISDPLKPVPHSENLKEMLLFTPRNYMSEDQRFAARRPDVLVFETDILEKDITFGGELAVNLKVATSSTDADWIVKLIDVYPPDEKDHPYLRNPTVTLSNYYQMVRSEVMPGRFRESFSKPIPFIPGKPEPVKFALQDVLHTFKKGHRIMVQVQSTWFPLIMRNPQKFMSNIYLAADKDYTKAKHTLYNTSYIEVDILP